MVCVGGLKKYVGFSKIVLTVVVCESQMHLQELYYNFPEIYSL